MSRELYTWASLKKNVGKKETVMSLVIKIRETQPQPNKADTNKRMLPNTLHLFRAEFCGEDAKETEGEEDQ